MVIYLGYSVIVKRHDQAGWQGKSLPAPYQLNTEVIGRSEQEFTMSITVRLWSKADLESLQHNRWLATVFMNGTTFGEEEMKHYPYNLRKEYHASWLEDDDPEGTRIYATDDTMLLRFIDSEYTRRPDYLAEVITRYRVIIG